MLKAILFGKKRGTGTEGEELAGGFTGAEDTLTATFFERLFYLPDEIVAKVLLEPFEDRTREPSIESIHFWPRWEGQDQPGYKEPDVVVVWREPAVVLVVEAKRYDFVGQQDAGQLGAELKAARGQFPDRPIWLLAVGGIADTRAKTVEDLKRRVFDEAGVAPDGVRLFAMMWFQLYLRLEEALGSRPSPHLARLLDDIREGMALHGVGVSKPVWLADLLEDGWSHCRGIRDESIRALALPGRPRAPVSLLDLAALGPIRASAVDLTHWMGGQTMNPPQSPLALSEVLLDVRKAYRLVAAFQSRVAAYIEMIRTKLGFDKYSGDIYSGERRATALFEKVVQNGWDYLPMCLARFTLLRRSHPLSDYPSMSYGGFPKTGDLMLVVSVVTDTGLLERKHKRGPDDLPDPRRTKTCLRVHLYLNEIDRGENSWWMRIFANIPKQEWELTGQPIESGSVPGITIYGEEWNLEDLPDEEALLRRIEEFADAVKDKLGVNLLEPPVED